MRVQHLVPSHRCTDSDCPFRGQATRPSCGCHKTSEQILLEERKLLLAAVNKVINNWGDLHSKDLAQLRMARDTVQS